jgi:hypothetical protein
MGQESLCDDDKSNASKPVNIFTLLRPGPPFTVLSLVSRYNFDISYKAYILFAYGVFNPF